MKVDFQKFKDEKINVVYHKNCIDGIFAAALVKIMADGLGMQANFIPCQYGEKLEIPGEDIVIFVDFSLKNLQMRNLISKHKEVYVFDHHGSAFDELSSLGEEYKNFFLVFDNSVCGTEVVFKNLYNTEIFGKINEEFILSITDMDLFKFKFDTTKPLRAILEFKTQKKDLELAIEIIKMPDEEIKQLAKDGEILTEYVWAGARKISKALVKKEKSPITICNEFFIAINNTGNTSEVGNQICEDMNFMSLQYFILDNMNVVCNLRSKDSLSDASRIAVFFGGGGHRNACGFQLPFEQLGNMLQNGFKQVVRFKATAKISKVVENESIGEDLVGYYYMNLSGRPLMFIMGNGKDSNEVYHYKNNKLENIKIDHSVAENINNYKLN